MNRLFKLAFFSASITMLLTGCGKEKNHDPKITDPNVAEVKPIPLPASPGGVPVANPNPVANVQNPGDPPATNSPRSSPVPTPD